MKRVLVADDDPALRALLRLVATRAGFEVASAANGLEALQLLQSESFDVALIDLMMPRMSGYELLQQIGELSHKPAIVVVTAMNDALLPRLDTSIVSSILRKPFDIDMLAAILAELSNGKKPTESPNGKVVDFPRRTS
jgi:CheY-like chemotaxis protein